MITFEPIFKKNKTFALQPVLVSKAKVCFVYKRFIVKCQRTFSTTCPVFLSGFGFC